MNNYKLQSTKLINKEVNDILYRGIYTNIRYQNQQPYNNWLIDWFDWYIIYYTILFFFFFSGLLDRLGIVTINHIPWSVNGFAKEHPTIQQLKDWGVDYVEVSSSTPSIQPSFVEDTYNTSISIHMYLLYVGSQSKYVRFSILSVCNGKQYGSSNRDWCPFSGERSEWMDYVDSKQLLGRSHIWRDTSEEYEVIWW